MAKRLPDFLPRNINQFTPSMAYAADVIHGGDYLADLGTPDAADSDYLITGRTVSGLVTTGVTFTATQLAQSTMSSQNFGVGIKFYFGGTCTVNLGRDVTVQGRDYLGQPMTETIPDSATQGSVTIAGVKAFKYVDSISIAAGSATNDMATGTFVCGFSGVLGLPYKAMNIGIDIENDSVVGTGGTFVAGAAATVTQTATTADPRGTWTPGDVPDGATKYRVELFVDTANMHGNAHYSD